MNRSARPWMNRSRHPPPTRCLDRLHRQPAARARHPAPSSAKPHRPERNGWALAIGIMGNDGSHSGSLIGYLCPHTLRQHEPPQEQTATSANAAQDSAPIPTQASQPSASIRPPVAPPAPPVGPAPATTKSTPTAQKPASANPLARILRAQRAATALAHDADSFRGAGSTVTTVDPGRLLEPTAETTQESCGVTKGRAAPPA